MRQLLIDPFSGIAGDMLVAALLDAGAPRAALEDVLASLPPEFEWQTLREKRHAIAGERFVVLAREGHVHRHLEDVLAILGAAKLSERARTWAERAFAEIAEAEGRCHDRPAEEIHFHEVGAIDAIVDVCGACALLDALDPAEVWCHPVAVGSGFVDCAHGRMPVPAPGTLELLRGMPMTGEALRGERATPTGVALLRAVGARFGSRPAGVVLATGYGAGTADPDDAPNLLRVVIEERSGAAEHVVELRTLVDDQSGEVVGDALEALHGAGAIEAFALAALAKKGRPAFEVVVLCEAAQRTRFEGLLFRLLGTLGMRVQATTRTRRPRQVEDRDTVLGRLPFKVRDDPDGGRPGKPEFAALARRAAELGLTPREALELLRAETEAADAPPDQSGE